MKKDPLLQGPQGTDEEDAIDNHFREDVSQNISLVLLLTISMSLQIF